MIKPICYVFIILGLISVLNYCEAGKRFGYAFDDYLQAINIKYCSYEMYRDNLPQCLKVSNNH